MDTRLLYITAVVVAAISGGYYYYSGKGEKLDADAAHSMIFTADEIQLLQTDDDGNLHVRAHVDQLEQNVQEKTSTLKNLNASLYHADQIDATFSAKKAQSFNDNEKVILSGEVKAVKIGQKGQMEFLTDELTGYPDLGTLETNHTVQVKAPGGDFVSRGLKADLNEGQYEFFNIRGKYAAR